jgi:beta-mannanase
MNGSWEPYSYLSNSSQTSTNFIAAWRHMHDLAVAARATNVTWVWCPNVDMNNSFTPYGDLYPGDSYVDWTGLDGFNKDFSTSQSFSTLFGTSGS